MDSLALTLELLAVLVGVPVLTGLAIAWHSERTVRLARRWARSNGLVLREVQYSWCSRGPFLFRAARGQGVARIRVRLRDGRRRSGWLLCGSRLFGLSSDAAQVRWDGPPTPRHARSLPRRVGRPPHVRPT